MTPKQKEISIPDSYTNKPYEHIKVAHHPSSAPSATSIIVVTLNRPEKHNAFTDTMVAELEEAFQLFDLDDRVKCIIVTGAGKMFCAGADLDQGFGKRGRTWREHRDGSEIPILSTSPASYQILTTAQRRQGGPRHAQMQKANHRRNQWISRWSGHNHDIADDHPDREQRSQNRVRLCPTRHNNGSVQLLFPPETDRVSPSRT